MVSHHDEEDEELNELEERDWQLVRGDSLELRAEALLCLSRRKGQDFTKQEEALSFADAAIDLYRELDDRKDVAAALWAKADPLYFLQRFAEARAACVEAAGIWASLLNEARAGKMFYNAGGCAYNLDDFEDGFKYFQKASIFYKSVSDAIETGRSLSWAAKCLAAQEKFDEAIPLYLEAIALFESEGAMLKLADCSRLLGKSYIGSGQLDLAEKTLDRADACLEFTMNDETPQKLKFAQGLLAAAQGDHMSAIDIFQELFEAGKELGMVEYTTANAFERAKSEMAIGLYEKAAKTFRQLALTLKGTESPITPLDALLQLLTTYQLAGSVIDQELVLNELFEMPEVTENADLSNRLTLHLGILMTGTSEGKRALGILEGLPRSSFAIGTESWIEHSLGLMQNYEQVGRRTECLFLANELLALSNIGEFHDALRLIKEIRANVIEEITFYDDESTLFV
ncbi:MAG: Soluble attachment protein [Actinomycetota bacterium]|jgi:tetratricopeptide (TPR) repeat protein